VAASGYAAYRRNQMTSAADGMGLVEAFEEALGQKVAVEEERTVPFMEWSLRVPEPKSGTLDFERFPFQREFYSRGAEDRELVIKKCLDPETRVLREDLRWVRIDDVKVGDRLVAIDEETQGPLLGGRVRRRRALRTATVQAAWDTRQDAYRITLADGRSIVATAEHRLLWRRSKLDPKWREVARMKPGDTLRHVTTPWEEPRTYEDGWFAGLLDGEGCVRNRAAGTECVITQQPGEVLERAKRYLKDRDFTFRESLEPRPNGRSVARLRLSRLDDVLRLVGSTQPSRQALRAPVWEGAVLGGTGDAWVEITSIETVGERRMIDLQTSEGTYVAEGIASHNSTQVGISAYLVRWTMFWADVRGLTALYVFPKQQQLYDFSDSRIRPLVLGSEYLRDRVPGLHVQNKGLKQIGMGFVYYRGSESKESLDSVDADVLALDEYDTLKQANIPDAERRISGSERGMIRRVGVPSIPDFGISKLYMESDQRRWHVKCSHCGDWQYLTFHDNVDQPRGLRICRKCLKSIEDDVGAGEWVAKYADRSVPGYHVPRLIVPGLRATGGLARIIQESKERAPYKVTVFHNKDLGEEYAPEEGRLSAAALAAAERKYLMSEGYVGNGLVTMGIDVASARDLNVRISLHNDDKTKGALHIGLVSNFNDLGDLMDRYGVKMACIDHMPENRLAKGFAERYAGRVYLVRFAGPNAHDVLTVDDESRAITVRRTEAIDATFQMVREQRNQLPLDRPTDYNQQMMAPIRFVERDELGRVTMGYRSTGPDDYAMAEVFDMVAAEAWRIRQNVEEAQREVLTPLDDLMEFRRGALHESDDFYSPGGHGEDEEEYSPGGHDPFDDEGMT
jgi:hypothetical protein